MSFSDFGGIFYENVFYKNVHKIYIKILTSFVKDQENRRVVDDNKTAFINLLMMKWSGTIKQCHHFSS